MDMRNWILLLFCLCATCGLTRAQEIKNTSTEVKDYREVDGKIIVEVLVNGKPSLASNYGANTVDIFAPGMEIYAASTGDTYQKASGTALAAGTVVGVAALVKGYYPELTAAQLRNLLIETATPRKGVIIEKTARANGQRVTDLFLFDELCRAKGIVNAYNAVVAADKMTK